MNKTRGVHSTTLPSTQRRGEMAANKKYFLTFLLCFVLIVLPVSGIAENLKIAATGYEFPESTVAVMRRSGEKTKGITFIVHDVYFDGYLLLLTITQAPNEPGYAVYNDVLGSQNNEDIRWIEKDGYQPVGAYCATSAFYQEREFLSVIGSGSRNGTAFTLTEVYHFLPNEAPDELYVGVAFGVMETPGETVGEIEAFDLKIPNENRIRTKSVTLNQDEPPYLKEIFVAQSDEVANIYAFYATGKNGYPVSFVNIEGEEIEDTSYTYKELDSTNYLYHAIRRSEPLTAVCVRDVRSSQIYSISLEDGTVTKVE